MASSRSGDPTKVHLRLDIGADDTNLDNSRKTAALEGLHDGGQVLRFTYTVQTGDTDTDGIWVQASSSNQVVFLGGTGAGKPTLVDAESSTAADLTKAGLPQECCKLEGAERAKVDGSTTSTGTVRPDSAEVDGKTLTVTFDAVLANTSAVDEERLATKLACTARATCTANTTPASTPAGSRYTGGRAAGHRGDGDAPDADLAPAPERGSAAGNTLRLVFSRALAEDSTPPGSAFQVWATDRNNDTRTIWGAGTAAVSGSEVTVKLDGAVRADERARVSYTKPDTGMLKDRLLHTEVASFRDFRIDSNHDATPRR